MEPASAPTSAVTSSRLALEIYMIIISYLSPSRDDLVQMSLVCRSWLSLCRYHLFSEVVYQDSFAAFALASTHATQSLMPHIRKIILRGHYSINKEECDRRHSFFRLTGINQIQIEHFNIDNDGFHSIFELLSQSKISTIQLRCLHFSSFTNFANLIDCANANLQSLSIDSISWEPISKDVPTFTHRARILPNTSLLKTISVRFSNTKPFFTWLAYGVPCSKMASHEDLGPRRNFPHLSRLCITDILAEEASAVGTFLSGAGDSLEHVELGMAAHDLDIRNMKLLCTIRLSDNPMLKSIVIRDVNLFQFPAFADERGSTGSSSPVTTSTHAWIPDLLSSVHATAHWVDVCIHLWFCTEEQLDTFPWEELDEALSSNPPKFDVEFRLSGIGWADTDVIKSWFTKRLLKTDADTITVNLNGFE